MDLQTTIYLFVGASFALYIGIAVWARAGSTSEFYAAGGYRLEQRIDSNSIQTFLCSKLAVDS